VVLIGRRGPAEAAFTNPELRELAELERADVIVDSAHLEGVAVPEDGDATRRRNVESLRDYSQGKHLPQLSCAPKRSRWPASARISVWSSNAQMEP
jgi:hypothetical protein